jgi:hypothetical protein
VVGRDLSYYVYYSEGEGPDGDKMRYYVETIMVVIMLGAIIVATTTLLGILLLGMTIDLVNAKKVVIIEKRKT